MTDIACPTYSPLYGSQTYCASFDSSELIYSACSLNIFHPLFVGSISRSMRRLESGGTWSLFDPYDVPSLPGLAGDAFCRAYEESERRGLATIQFPASNLWGAICDAQRESGTPFLCYADNINRA